MSGEYKTSDGFSCQINGAQANAFGHECVANGNQAIAAGFQAVVDGDQGFAHGYKPVAVLDKSYAHGLGEDRSFLRVPFEAATVDDTETELLNGESSYSIPEDAVVGFEIFVVAKNITTGGILAAMTKVTGLMAFGVGIIGTPDQLEQGTTDFEISVSVEVDTNDDFHILVTGPDETEVSWLGVANFIQIK